MTPGGVYCCQCCEQPSSLPVHSLLTVKKEEIMTHKLLTGIALAFLFVLGKSYIYF